MLLMSSALWSQVTVYEHINYGGKSHTYKEGEHHLTPTIGDNLLSSVKVSPGWKVTIQEHGPGRTDRGRSIVLTSDTPELDSRNFNDIASTVIVERAGAGNNSTNIARGKSCRASSVNFDGVASRAVDGNTDGIYTNNSCTHTQDEKDPWFEIDLGDFYDVTKIVIWNRTDECCWNRLQGFYVMASEKAITANSTDNAMLFKNGPLSFKSGSEASMTLEGNKKCRYIRICIPGNIKILSLAEIEVYGQLSSSNTSSVSNAVNVAKGKSCRASSVNLGGVASRAVDGNTNGNYSNNSCTHTQDENDPWLEIDLGGYYDVSQIVIWNRTDECCWNRLQGFYVMASAKAITANNFEDKSLLYKNSAFSFKSASQSNITLDGSKRCRYVRIFIPGSMKTLSLAEIEVYGQLSASQAAPKESDSSTSAAAETSLPDKFKVLAFSVNEGKKEQDQYWFAINNNNSRGVILSTAKLVNGSKWLEIERVKLGDGVIAFKILNAGNDMYLVAKDNKEVHIEKSANGEVPEAAKFKTVKPLTTAKGANENNFRSFESVKFPGHYLRHQGYVLFVHPSNQTELFKQDASWLIEKM